jgi:SAM-dependent methyltransferase
MTRLQLFEFNERAECPTFIRDALIETLGLGLKIGGVYKNVAPIFAEFCQTVQANRVLDLCSGSGEPASILISALHAQEKPCPQFTLSDLFPNTAAMQAVADRHPNLIKLTDSPVDATDIPNHLTFPACTIISAFHHFAPHVAQRIIKNCVDQNRGIFIVEPFTKNIKRASAPIPALATSAYLNPLVTSKDKLLKGIFTYGVPLIPLLGAWDATVSLNRIYSKRALYEMTAPFTSFHWRYEEVSYPPFGKALVFLGMPIN